MVRIYCVDKLPKSLKEKSALRIQHRNKKAFSPATKNVNYVTHISYFKCQVTKCSFLFSTTVAYSINDFANDLRGLQKFSSRIFGGLIRVNLFIDLVCQSDWGTWYKAVFVTFMIW